MSVQIHIDTSGMDKKIYDIKNGLEKAMRAASKRATDHGKTKIDAVIRERIAVQKQSVMAQIYVKKQGKHGHILTLEKSDRVSLRRFGARQVGKQPTLKRDDKGRWLAKKATRAKGGGVTYKIGKSGARGFVPHAFIVAKLNNQVFKRTNGNKSMPIQKLWGPSVWGAFTGGAKQETVKDATPDVSESISIKFKERLEHEVNYLITKANK